MIAIGVSNQLAHPGVSNQLALVTYHFLSSES